MKRTLCVVILIVLGVTIPASTSSSQDKADRKERIASPGTRAVDYLAKVMDQFHATYDVYTDADAAGNHFVVRPRMSSFDNACQSAEADETVPPMNEAWTTSPHSGLTCIRASFRPKLVNNRFNWGGWYFMNGIQREAGFKPERGKEECPDVTQESAARNSRFSLELPNWGHYQDSGVTELTGATRVTFWARGERGGERVEFFALGVGWDADYKKLHGVDTRQKDPVTGEEYLHADSSPKVSKTIPLTRDWQPYSLELKGRNLSYVLGGFGWAAGATENGMRPITFYMDDIRYELDQAARDVRLNEPRFLVSYETKASSNDFDRVMRNAAHTYDNALALMAFLAVGDQRRAKLIADALVYAQQHDRFYPQDQTLAKTYRGSLRNVYQGGDLSLPPGWISNGRARTARLPGWYEKPSASWFEDNYSVSLDAGNMAWTMLALLAYHNTVMPAGGSQYLSAAKEIGEWVNRNCYSRDGQGGYTGGFQGWEPNPKPATYKATEHNIDLYAAFQHLYLITGDEKWSSMAAHAGTFVQAMWDDTEGKFWTGTREDGVTINKEVIPLDIQAWAVLSLNNEKLLGTRDKEKALRYVEDHMRLEGGYDYSRRLNRKLSAYQDREGIWYEGTAQMAVAYEYQGDQAKWRQLTMLLMSAQLESGALPASNQELGLRTGFPHPDVEGNRYFRRSHVGATAWLALAELGVNPFWMGSRKQ